MPGIVNWVGKQRKRAQVDTITVGSNTAAQTFPVAVGAKSFEYVATASDTTNAILATNLLAALQGLTDPEFTELTFAAGTTSATITVTGPDNGKPFTLTAGGGTGTISSTTTTDALSPNDWTDPVNFDTGVLPTTGDTAVIADNAIDISWNLDGNTDVFTVQRKSTHTGRIGLPTTSDAGYPEYRPTHLELAATSVLVETNSSDTVAKVRIKSTAGSAATYLIQSDTTVSLGSEPVELHGLPASSIVEITGSGVAIATGGGQVAAVVTLVGQSAAVRVGSGVTLGAATLKACQGRIDCNYTSLTMLDSGQVTTGAAATGSSNGTLIYKGTLTWRSTGGPGNSPVVGQGGVIDFSQAPGSVIVGGTVELNFGSTWYDPRGACGSYNAKTNRCTLADVSFFPGTNRTLAVS